MRQRLAQFTLIEQIGAGGMGVVYRARDSRLDRDVAIKVLPAGALSDGDARKRFRKEALALSRLSHPGIAVVHDFSTDDDVDFLVMELVPGTTLDEKLVAGPLPEDAILSLGLQLAEALSAAHQAGVIHRDLKPGNLRVTPDGRLKVLDFGLARSLHSSPDAATESVIDVGSTAGTVPYMAPEQLRGESIDPRTDIWATGIVLFEMATGKRPFQATTAPALAGDILHKPVPAPRQLREDLSPQLERVILKCLEKDPSARYQSANDLSADLRACLIPSAAAVATAPRRSLARLMAVGVVIVLIGAAVAWQAPWRSKTPATDDPPGVHTLIVLPLENLSRDDNEQYLVDGLTETLITEVSKVSPLKVIASGSVARARQQGKGAGEISRDLGADAYMEGSVQRTGERVRVSARLVHAGNSRLLWSESYERNLKDILNLQREIASAVSSAVAPATAPEPWHGAKQDVNPAAHEAYLRGRYFWNKRTVEDFQKAITYFERAVAQDPGYAAAYSGLADTYVSLYDYGFMSAADVAAKVRVAARRAIDLDPRSAEGHASLAHLALHDWDWAGAERQFREAITIDGSYVTAHHWYALCLTAMGRTDEAVAAMERAQKLDPLSLRINADLGMALLAAGKYDEAIAQEDKTLELQPGYRTAVWIQGMALQQRGRLPEAIQNYRQALASAPNNPNIMASLGNALAEAGRTSEARKVLADLEKGFATEEGTAFFFALVHAGLDQRREALDWLEKAYKERSGSIRYLKVEPRLNRLRPEPRFQDLMRRVGLADARLP